MLEKKTPFSRTTIIWTLVAVLGLAGVITLVFAFNGNSPEEDVNAIYTNAALTVEAQQLTLLASQPTSTVTPFVTLTPFATNTVFATSTLPPLSAFATNTQAVSNTGGCNNSVFVSDVTFPDNAVVTPGQALTKTWKIQNSGTCAWTATYKVSFVSGNAMGGATTAIGQAVGPGQSVDISVAMVAPATVGEAKGYWTLTNDSGQNFGNSFYILVKVGGVGTTGTATTATAGTPGTPVSKPAAANNPTVTLTCTVNPNDANQYQHVGTLTWEDQSNNETGFNVYINGALVTTTSAGVILYNVPASAFYAGGTVTTFGVEAFNSAGKANIAIVTSSCP